MTESSGPPREYVELVRRLEVQARKHPDGFRRRITLLVFLGYAFLALCFVVAAALLGGLIVLGVFLVRSGHILLIIKTLKILVALAIPVLLFVLSITFTLTSLLIRILWFRVDPPSGLELDRGMAPQLFRLIDELRKPLDTPMIHAVLLDGDFNAGVVQIPRLGLLGGYKNYLVLGLPLMQALSPEQFRAVLAHELGHISGQHGRFGLRIHSAWMTWMQLLENLQASEEKNHGTAIVLAFFNWYAPLFAAHHFALRRADEYQADRCAKRVAGPQHAAEALLAINTVGRYLGEVYWPRIEAQVAGSSEESPRIFSALPETLKTAITGNLVLQWRQEALEETTGFDDTHPCLKERLTLLGYNPDIPEGDASRGLQPLPTVAAPAVSAAQEYLGPTLERAADVLDQIYEAMMQLAIQHQQTELAE